MRPGPASPPPGKKPRGEADRNRFIHGDVVAVAAAVPDAGFELVSRDQTTTWSADVYVKVPPTERA